MLVELISEMFIENFINIDIINIIIIDLLHVNNFSNIEDIEYESLYNMIKLIYDNNCIKPRNFEENKFIFNEYITIIKNIIQNIELKKRSIFFMNDIINMLKKLINDKTTDEVNVINDSSKIIDIDNSSKKNLFNILKNINNINNKEFMNLYKNLNNKDKYDVVYKIIDLFISQKNINKNIINLLNDIKDFNTINTVIEKFIGNIDDIILDIPMANSKIIYIIENTDYEFNNNLLETLNNVNDSDDSD